MTINLMAAFNEIAKKEGYGKEKLTTITYPTGMDYFDYRNGKVENNFLLTGINGGKITTFIGKSGTGKSTFAIQTAWNIVKDIPNALTIHFDFERATTLSRIQALLGVDVDTFKEKYTLFNSEISSESLYRTIRGIAKLKEEKRDQLLYNTGQVDNEGKPVYELPPTVILVDSWSTMTPENIIDVANEELGLTNMSGAQTAKYNNAMINALVPVLEKCNIILMPIGHITTKITTGTPTAAQINYLKQDESISGGVKFLYLSDTLVKFIASTKLEEEKDFGVKGFMVVAELIKSRSNESGRKVELVFTQKRGFNNLLTNFNTLKKAGFLKGNGRAYYFEFMPDYKFTQKTFVDKYMANEDFAKQFDELVAACYEEMVYVPDIDYNNSENVQVEEESSVEE